MSYSGWHPRLLESSRSGQGGGAELLRAMQRRAMEAILTALAVGESLRGRGTSAGECRSKPPVHPATNAFLYTSLNLPLADATTLTILNSSP